MFPLLLLIAAQARTQAPPAPPPPNPPLIPAFFTGQRLYDICGQSQAGLCSMYVAGVLDGLFYAESRGTQPSLCRAPINNREAAELVVRYLERNPQIRSRAAAVGVERAVSERLSCAPPPEEVDEP